MFSTAAPHSPLSQVQQHGRRCRAGRVRFQQWEVGAAVGDCQVRTGKKRTKRHEDIAEGLIVMRDCGV